MKLPVSSTLQNAGECDLPLELQLDLLADGELEESQRNALLTRLNREPPSPWRDLAVRFLERQVEKETVRQLMAGGRLVPVEFVGSASSPPAVAGRISPRLGWTLATAAGLLLVATSAMVTYQLTQPVGRPMVAGDFRTNLPAEAVSSTEGIAVSVPLVTTGGMPAYVLSPEQDAHASRQSVVIQPDGRGNAVVIPVTTLKPVIY